MRLKKLILRSNQIIKIENLSQSIHVLDVSRNRISKIENLPQNINDIMDVEVPIMLENQKSGKTKVVPVILRRCG